MSNKQQNNASKKTGNQQQLRQTHQYQDDDENEDFEEEESEYNIYDGASSQHNKSANAAKGLISKPLDPAAQSATTFLGSQYNYKQKNQQEQKSQSQTNYNQQRNTQKSQEQRKSPKRQRTNINEVIQEEDGDEYTYEEIEVDEDDISQFGMSRASDIYIQTPNKSVRTKITGNRVRNQLQGDAKNQEIQEEYNKIYKSKKEAPPDYFNTIRKRKEGVPIKTQLPQNIEAQYRGNSAHQKEMNDTLQSITDYKEAIPSFLPNEKKYRKFEKLLQNDETEQKEKLERIKPQNEGNYNVTRRTLKNKQYHGGDSVPYMDPFEAHMQKNEDNFKKVAKKSGEYSPGDSMYSNFARDQNESVLDYPRQNGFRSVQRKREDQFVLPEIKDQIQTLERKMEKELDMEAKLKKDAQKLIVHALGKNAPKMDRTVKAWLRKESDNQKEIQRNKMNFPLMDQFLKKGVLNLKDQNALVVMKEKLQQENLQRINELKMKQEGPQYVFNYDKIKVVYNVSLLDIHFGTSEAYFLKKKHDAKQTISHVFKRKFEEKLIFQQLKNPKTLRIDKVRLEEKLKMIATAIELAKQRLEWLIYDTPFTIQELEEEVRTQKQENKNLESEQLKKLAIKFKNDREFYEEMQKKSREARNLLNIQMLEARALKNRSGCESISDFVLMYREFMHVERLPEMYMVIHDALLNKKKSEDFFNFIKKIVEFEEEMIRIRKNFNTDLIEEQKADMNDKFFNYDEIILDQLKLEEKDELLKYFKQSKVIFQFLPFWFIPIDKQDDPYSNTLRNLLKFDIVQAKVLCSFFSCSTFEEIVTYQRHNRKNKEFYLFEKEELSFLVREHKIPESLLREFGQLISIIAKEYMMVPLVMFSLAKPSQMQEVNFSNLKSQHLTVDAIASIVACINMHQMSIKRLIFENCELDGKSAVLFKLILSDERKPIIHCSFENNKLGDQGLDHIVQAIKNNPKGDMRILKLSNNELSIQAAIRLAHVLKKRQSDLPPVNLQILKMSHNKISSIGTETIASFMKKNQTLKFLDISFNDVGDRGLFALADSLRENDKLIVLNLLGNDFTDKSLPALSTALLENKKLNLIILKIGTLNCQDQQFINFINTGFLQCTKIKYMYLTTNQFNQPILRTINDNFLPKVLIATEKYDQKIDSSSLLNFMSQVVEFQLFEGGNTQKVYKFGEKLLREIINEKYTLNSNEILIFLFENIFGPEFVLKDNLTPFHLFAKHGLIDGMSYCLKLGISPNFKTSIAYKDYPSATALHIAAGFSQLEMCKYLLKFGVEIDNKDQNGNTALHYAAVQGSVQLASLLIQEGKANVLLTNKKNMLPIHSCIFSDNMQCFRFLLRETERQKSKAYLGQQIEKAIDIKAYQGLTPIMIALEENAETIFQHLLENGADLRAQDEEGNSILHRAILLKDSKKAKMLIKNNINIHLRSFAGDTPIMMAVRNGLMDVVRTLVHKGADIHEKNYKGDSLLHLSARVDQADLVGYFLDKGLSTTDKNRDGQRPQDVAVRKGIKLMLQEGNQRQHDVYKNQNKTGITTQATRIREQQALSDATSDDDHSVNEALAKQKNARLLNEELIKYKIDKKDTIGSTYQNRFDNYDATQLSKPRSDLEKQKTGGRGKSQNKIVHRDEANEDLEDGDEDGEEFEDRSRSTMQYSKYSDTRNKGANGQYKQNNPIQTKAYTKGKESAGFRGTVDLVIPQHRNIMPETKNFQSTNNPKTMGYELSQARTKNPNKMRHTMGEEGEEEFDDEDGEEFEDDDEDELQDQQSHNTHKTQHQAKSKSNKSQSQKR